MAISVTCPKCAHALKAKDELAGKKVMCPKCEAIIAISAAQPAAASAAASPAAAKRTATSCYGSNGNRSRADD